MNTAFASIRLIATDLDGTLVTGADGQLPQGLTERVQALKEKGIYFAAASGRQLGNLRRFFGPLSQDMAFIAENGGLVETEKGRLATYFDQAVAEEIIRDLRNAGMELLLSAPDTCFMMADADRAYTDHMIYTLRNTSTILEDEKNVTAGLIKISGYAQDGAEAPARPLLAKWRGRTECALAGKCWLDFTVSNKGAGLAALSRQLQIPLAHMAAFGDHYNDVSMLDQAGFPFLMETAPAPLHQRGYRPCRSVIETLDDILSALENP